MFGQDREFLLNEGRGHESKYDWVAAIELYKKALTITLDRNGLSEKARTFQRIGFCYQRAAMQAGNPREFKNHLLKACNGYAKAAEILAKIEGLEELARRNHCEAAAAYVSSLLGPDIASRKRFLNECWRLEKEALRLYGRIGSPADLGETYNELSACLVDQLNLEWNKQTRRKMLKEALAYEGKAMTLFSEQRGEYELARAFTMASRLCHTAAEGLEADKSKYAREALNYSRKAVELSEKAGDRFLLGMSSIWAGSAIVDQTDHPGSATKHFQKALECGMRTRDNYLIGKASYLLAFVMAWRMITEEDPEKIRETSRKCERYCQNAIRSFELISNNEEIARSYYWRAENYSVLAKSAETHLGIKRRLLKKSIEAARKGLEHAENSGSANAAWFIRHPLSKSLFLLATLETDSRVKKQLLNESLRYREESIKALGQAMPYFFWNHGVYHNYLALIQAELAKIEAGKERRTRLLEDAAESAENCMRLCSRSEPFSQAQYTTLGRYYSDYGVILSQLHNVTDSDALLDKLLLNLERAVETYEKAGLPSRAAESYWQLAKAQSASVNFPESAESFDLAHEQYIAAAEKIPSLRSFYLNHASYMKAWSEIQKARHSHLKQQYAQAKKHYERAASLHSSSKPWRYLVSNYLAWAQLEQGEDLSRTEQPEKAKSVFLLTAKLFVKVKKSIEGRLESIETGEEKEMASELVKASDARREYCLGRAALEEAKILDRRGEYLASSRKYGSATEGFQKTIKAIEHESDHQELKPVVYLCRAWQMVMRAEAEASPELFLKASMLFDEAKERSYDEKAKLLALGHSCFCKALEAGRRFEATRDATFHTAATLHLEGAADYYFRAGFKSASEYAKATQRFFDAHMYIHKAKTEMNPLQKAQFYQMSERLLRASESSYARAKRPEKRKDVQRLIDSIREERELAMSLSEALYAPAIMSSTASFLTPTPTLEKPVGLERFEHANIQADLTLNAKEIGVGEDFTLRIQIANTGRGTIQLIGVEGALPEGFELVAKPDHCGYGEECLKMKGKRLDPLASEEIKLVSRCFEKGTFKISPSITYVDETGRQLVSKPKPMTISIFEVVLPGRITTGLDHLDRLLFGGLPKNYSTVLTSPSCDEKNSLIKKFLESGVKTGQVTFLVTMGTSGIRNLAEASQGSFYVFICNPRAETMVEGMPNVFELKGVENLTEITIALTRALRTLDEQPSCPRRACIEIVSDVLLQHHAVQTKRWLNDLIPELRSRGFTTLATMNPQMHSPGEVQAILELFDGELSIFEKETEDGTARFLKIRKMFNQRYLESELALGDRLKPWNKAGNKS